MYKFIKTQQRPSDSTLFFFERYPPPTDYTDYITKNYIETKKIIGYQKIVSLNKMKVTIIMTWQSRLDFLSYLTDEYVFNVNEKANDYDIDNNILTTVEIAKDNE